MSMSNHLGLIWYHSEPSDVPYIFPKPVSWLALFLPLLKARRLQQKAASVGCAPQVRSCYSVYSLQDRFLALENLIFFPFHVMTASLGTLKPHLFIGTLLLPPTITFLINVKQRLFFDRNSLEPQNKMKLQYWPKYLQVNNISLLNKY